MGMKNDGGRKEKNSQNHTLKKTKQNKTER